MSDKGDSASRRSVTQIVRLLARGDVSRNDLQLATGRSLDFIADVLNDLRAVDHTGKVMVHVTSYGEDSRGRVSVERFTLGHGDDAPRQGRRKRGGADLGRRKQAIVGKQLQDLMLGAPKATPSPRRRALISIPKAISEVAATE